MALLARISSCAAFAALTAQHALAQAGSPQGSGPLVAAVNWVVALLTGPIAISVGVVAVAICGFMMLTGRLNWKHGLTVLIGLFIVFGAPAIVVGIRGAANVGG
jgi:type IV secretory pathway VirB2 component (pilin)